MKEDKVRSGRYTSASEPALTLSQREGIRRRIDVSITAIERGEFDDYDGDGLLKLAKEMVQRSTRKLASRKNTGL